MNKSSKEYSIGRISLKTVNNCFLLIGPHVIRAATSGISVNKQFANLEYVFHCFFLCGSSGPTKACDWPFYFCLNFKFLYIVTVRLMFSVNILKVG